MSLTVKRSNIVPPSGTPLQSINKVTPNIDPLNIVTPSDITLPSNIIIENQPRGSAFINNTSYSGCDIKVVVHLYDGDAAANKYIDELNQQIMDTEDELTVINDNMSFVNNKLSVTKQGTKEYNSLSGLVVRYVNDKNNLNNLINTIYDKIQTIQESAPKTFTKVLADLQTISLSSYREKQTVRSFGHTYPKGFVRSIREIAGSMVFTMFNEDVLYELLDTHPSDFDGNSYTSSILDQLPPVDITIAFANEYGYLSRMSIYGVEFLTEGITMSIEDILTEKVVQYKARDYDPMRAVGNRKIDYNSGRLSGDIGKKASSLLLEEDYKEYKNSSSPFTRFNNRNNRFL